MMGIGKMIYRMVMGWRLGQMDPNMRDFIRKVKKMDKGNTCGQMEAVTMDNGIKIEYLVQGSING
jgi:hypothetical protein